MRVRIASALFALFALLSSASSAAAQSSPIPSQPLQQAPQKLPSSNKPLPPLQATQIVLLPGQIGSANDLTTSSQERKAWIGALQDQKNGLAMNMRRFGSGPDAPNCAHIMIYLAPKMDSEMLIAAPPEESGDVATLQGLPPCRRDLRAPMTAQRFYSAPPMPQVPPRRPFMLQPPASQIPSSQPRPVQPKADTPSAKP